VSVLNSLHIPAFDTSSRETVQARIDQKTKPPGALGMLEAVALQLALIQKNPDRLSLNNPVMVVFAADHGIAAHPVSIAPQAVTRQMVFNFLAGGAAINCFCRSNDITLKVVDAGILEAIDNDHPDFIVARSGNGTADMSEQPAMTADQLEDALSSGVRIAQTLSESGHDLFAFGEMGIGNTSAASALLSLMEQLPAELTTGLGTGISVEQLTLKQSLILKTIERVRSQHPNTTNGITHSITPDIALQEAGGFEIAQITGAILGAASQQRAVLIDGFIVSVAALLAVRMKPECRDYLLFAHRSAEAAHKHILETLDAEPLLDLGLRLGEGTGAALAMPLLRAACAFYNDMASFESAGVTV